MHVRNEGIKYRNAHYFKSHLFLFCLGKNGEIVFCPNHLISIYPWMLLFLLCLSYDGTVRMFVC
ncbi:hypothetical protein I7I50_10763 [Histoplasma capsulatum G186AR]|uniref:Uncharacterized protein n=1 Tax=Ajellomyces capsulatus TaxID=5037 RepID=A0A8H7Z786_AJECA|nr:hypothetical protein I7I52_02002 [Histoplasma capsulatum]QSS69464.1 hypothetical protein I7I50_10763 [Histoplasma capsulatum G186AR]